MDEDDEHSHASSAIDALAGAALASLPATNPRLHSARHDVPVSALDPADAPSIGMIYGLNRHDGMQPQNKRRKLSTDPTQSGRADIHADSAEEPDAEEQAETPFGSASPPVNPAADAEPLGLISRLDSLHQYAEVGLQPQQRCSQGACGRSCRLEGCL